MGPRVSPRALVNSLGDPTWGPEFTAIAHLVHRGQEVSHFGMVACLARCIGPCRPASNYAEQQPLSAMHSGAVRGRISRGLLFLRSLPHAVAIYRPGHRYQECWPVCLRPSTHHALWSMSFTSTSDRLGTSRDGPESTRSPQLQSRQDALLSCKQGGYLRPWLDYVLRASRRRRPRTGGCWVQVSVQVEPPGFKRTPNFTPFGVKAGMLPNFPRAPFWAGTPPPMGW